MTALGHTRAMRDAVQLARAKRQFRRWETTLPARWVTAVNYAHAYVKTEKDATGFVSVRRPTVKLVEEPVPGIVARYRVTTGATQTSGELAAKAKNLAEGLGVHAVRIIPGRPRRTPTGAPEADIIHTLLVLIHDPLPPDEVWEWAEWVSRRDDPGSGADGARDQSVSFAMTELHRPLEAPVAGVHLLGAGTTRSGKTFTCAAIEAGMSLWQPRGAVAPQRVIMISVGDVKHKLAMRMEPRATITARTVPHIEAMLAAHRDLFDWRQRNTPLELSEVRNATEAVPICRVVLDELASYMRAKFDAPGAPASADYKTMGAVQQRREDLLVDLAEKSAEAGGVLSLWTQYPTDKVIPTSVRNNMGFRMLHRVPERQQPAVVLGDGLDSFSFDEVSDADQGEIFYRRNSARGGRGAREERNRVHRAKALYLSTGDQVRLFREAAPLAPTAASSPDVERLLRRYGHWCAYFGVDPSSHEVPGMETAA